MVTSALTVFLVSVFVFFTTLILVQRERRYGRRFFAERLRAFFDRGVEKIGKSILNSWNHFVRYIVQLHWYYSIHSVLRTMLRALVVTYTYFEKIFERNRSRTKKLRAEKRQLSELNHLQQMAVHKEDTALTPAEKRKLRKKKLEGK